MTTDESTKPPLIVMTNLAKVAATESAASSELVVVHRVDGTLVKGLLQCDANRTDVVPLLPLPQTMHVRSETSSESFLIRAFETKAVFFVKRHEGALDHEEVKFFTDIAATDLWIRIRFADGEVLEGQTQNNTRLLLDPGVWLRPFDSTGNNVLVYVPKSSVAEFHVMGVAIHRPYQGAPTATI